MRFGLMNIFPVVNNNVSGFCSVNGDAGLTGKFGKKQDSHIDGDSPNQQNSVFTNARDKDKSETIEVGEVQTELQGKINVGNNIGAINLKRGTVTYQSLFDTTMQKDFKSFKYNVADAAQGEADIQKQINEQAVEINKTVSNLYQEALKDRDTEATVSSDGTTAYYKDAKNNVYKQESDSTTTTTQFDEQGRKLESTEKSNKATENELVQKSTYSYQDNEDGSSTVTINSERYQDGKTIKTTEVDHIDSKGRTKSSEVEVKDGETTTKTNSQFDKKGRLREQHTVTEGKDGTNTTDATFRKDHSVKHQKESYSTTADGMKWSSSTETSYRKNGSIKEQLKQNFDKSIDVTQQRRNGSLKHTEHRVGDHVTESHDYSKSGNKETIQTQNGLGSTKTTNKYSGTGDDRTLTSSTVKSYDADGNMTSKSKTNVGDEGSVKTDKTYDESGVKTSEKQTVYSKFDNNRDGYAKTDDKSVSSALGQDITNVMKQVKTDGLSSSQKTTFKNTFNAAIQNALGKTNFSEVASTVLKDGQKAETVMSELNKNIGDAIMAKTLELRGELRTEGQKIADDIKAKGEEPQPKAKADDKDSANISIVKNAGGTKSPGKGTPADQVDKKTGLFSKNKAQDDKVMAALIDTLGNVAIAGVGGQQTSSEGVSPNDAAVIQNEMKTRFAGKTPEQILWMNLNAKGLENIDQSTFKKIEADFIDRNVKAGVFEQTEPGKYEVKQDKLTDVRLYKMDAAALRKKFGINA